MNKHKAMEVIYRHTVVVNGIEIDVEIDFDLSPPKEAYRFPTLYKIDKLGRTSFWRIYTLDNKYYRESGILGGKVKTYNPTEVTIKNVGKSNETSLENQALFEAYAEWKHKKDQLYTEEKVERGGGKVETSGIGNRLRPMLAEKYTDRKKYIKFPCAVSRKLDGVRCMIFQQGSDITILSRQGKEYNFLTNIREEARRIFDQYEDPVVLDGELYAHNLPFNAVSGAVRSKNKPSAFDAKIEFHIFDLYLPEQENLGYMNRMKLLQTFSEMFPFKSLQFVYSEIVEDEKQLSEKHTQYVSEGYEGLMVRNLNGPYRLGRRVNDLQKYKEFEDAEFKVVDVLEGNGTEKGAAVFVCAIKDTLFHVRPRGSIERRRIQFRNKDKFIGKMLTVRYQPLSKEDVLPRFPVGIKFDSKTELIGVDVRDYE